MRHEREVVGLLLLVTVVVRLIALARLPVDLNQDEASTGYEAWALLNYGMDRCGNRWPVLLMSWGSGQNVLYSLLDIPFIAVFGLNRFSLRLPAALIGIAAVVLFWRLARQCRGKICGLCALFLSAINPWHIMASRWALESNIMPAFLLAGLLCTVKARKRIGWLFGAAAAFALALYAYGTAFFFMPLFLVVYVLLNRSLLRDRIFYLAAVLFILLALPISFCQLINLTGGESFTLLGMTIPKLTQGRQAAVSVFGSGLSGTVKNAGDFLRLLIIQSDGLRYNALPSGGIYYFFGLPLSAIGLWRSIKERKSHKETPLRLALYVACLCACMISVNINRVNMVWFPLLYFQSVGMEWLQGRLGTKGCGITLAGILLCFALFLVSYGKEGENTSNLEGLNDAIAFAEMASDQDIYITDSLHAPYIYVLFLRQVPPMEFADTVIYSNPEGAFRDVRSFGRYRFRDETGVFCLVLTKEEMAAVDGVGYTCLAEFGNYVVCLNC